MNSASTALRNKAEHSESEDTVPTTLEAPTTEAPTKKRARKSAARKPLAAKKESQPKAEKSPWANSTSSGPLPAVDDLRLAPNGVRASEKSRHIVIEFSNGFRVSLFPANVNKKDTIKVRDLMVDWLKKRLGS